MGKKYNDKNLVFNAETPSFLLALKGMQPEYSLLDKEQLDAAMNNDQEENENDDEGPLVEYDEKKFTKEQVKDFLEKSTLKSGTTDAAAGLDDGQMMQKTVDISDESLIAERNAKVEITTNISANVLMKQKIAVPGVGKKKTALSKDVAATIKATKNKRLLSFDQDD